MLRICPIMSRPEELEGCKEEQCALWNDYEQRCSLHLAARALLQLCELIRRREV